jgi:hypothetical protein
MEVEKVHLTIVHSTQIELFKGKELPDGHRS